MIRLSTIALATATALVLAGGCTWVKMAPGASAVRVIGAGGPPAGCTRQGEIAVSVKDSVAFYERNNLRVREELETLARNEAPGLEADTIQPMGPPTGGEQRFSAYRCGSVTPAPGPAPGAAEQESPQNAVQTYPVGR